MKASQYEMRICFRRQMYVYMCILMYILVLTSAFPTVKCGRPTYSVANSLEGEKKSCPFNRSLTECYLPSDFIYLHAMKSINDLFPPSLKGSFFSRHSTDTWVYSSLNTHAHGSGNTDLSVFLHACVGCCKKHW